MAEPLSLVLGLRNRHLESVPVWIRFWYDWRSPSYEGLSSGMIPLDSPAPTSLIHV